MITLSAFILLSAVIAKPVNSVSLTQLMPERIEQGMASVGLNRGYGSIWWPPEAKPVRFGDRAFEHGLGMRANNSVTFRLDGRYQRFQGGWGWTPKFSTSPRQAWSSESWATARNFSTAGSCARLTLRGDSMFQSEGSKS